MAATFQTKVNRACLALFLVGIQLGCATKPQPRTTTTPKPATPPERCVPAQQDLLERAIAREAGRKLPIRVEVDDVAAIHVRYDSSELDVTTARVLARFHPPAWATGVHLDLDRVERLSKEVAVELAKWRPPEPEFFLSIELNGLQQISAEVAEALAGWEGVDLDALDDINWDYYEPGVVMRLELGGISTLEAPVSRALIERWRSPIGIRLELALDGVKALKNDGLQSLEPSPETTTHVWLGSLAAVDAAQAATLASWTVWGLHLDGVEILDLATVQSLTTFSGHTISLNGVTRIDAEIAKALVAWNPRRPSRERRIEAQVRAARRGPQPAEEDSRTDEERIESAIAAMYDRELQLRGAETTPEVAEILAGWAGERLPTAPEPPSEPMDAEDLAAGCELTTIQKGTVDLDSADVAEAMYEWDGVDVVPLLDALSEADAASIRAENEESAAAGPPRLSVDAARRLAGFEGNRLWLDYVTELSAEAAAELAKWPGRRLYLNGLKTLDEPAARALAQWQGRKLELDGLESITQESAAALATWTGATLELDGLQTLEPEVAAALAKWKGRKLELDGVTALTPSAAAALSSWGGETLELDGTTFVDPATLQSLISMQPEVRRDGLPMSLNRSIAGVAVPERLSASFVALLGLPAGTYSFLDEDEVCTTGEELSAGRAAELSALSELHRLDLSSVTQLTAESAATLAAWPGKELVLDGLVSLDARTAAGLALWKGDELMLNGISMLDPETATALGAAEADQVELSGIKSLDAATVAALLPLGARLVLNPLVLVHPDSAKKLLRAKVYTTPVNEWADRSLCHVVSAKP